MPEEQLDFLNKLGQQPEAKVEEVDERSLAREVLSEMFGQESVEEKVRIVLKKYNLGTEKFNEVVRLVKNTLIDKGDPDINY